jgi:hypothetical protein
MSANMKLMRWSVVGQVIAGVLVGFAIGIDTYLTFFLPPSTHGNGWAEFIASGCGVAGMLLMFGVCSEIRREHNADTKHAP